jgi:hypothetical protein
VTYIVPDTQPDGCASESAKGRPSWAISHALIAYLAIWSLGLLASRGVL